MNANAMKPIPPSLLSSPALLFLFILFTLAIPIPSPAAKPEIWISPPGQENGRAFRELMTHPEAWPETRAAIDGIFLSDLNLNKQFTDDELRAWLPRLGEWKLKLAMEVGAIKPWGPTGEKTFAIERPMWERIERLGGRIQAIAMDEPLCCARKEIHKPDDYAVRETANYIALVRRHFPRVLIGDIEPYPFIPLADQIKWIDALQKRLAELGVRGLDFYRLDVNWAEFTVFSRGGWPEVRKLELACRQRRLPFSLIYWASEYPGLKSKGLADDATWYVGIMQQGYDYAMVGGAPDQMVIESWIGAPDRCLPEGAEFTFTRSVRDFCRRFAK
jgi:hypothetical protein